MSRGKNQGAVEFYQLLQRLTQLPEVHLPGRPVHQEGAVVPDYATGQRLVAEALRIAGLTSTDPERTAGLTGALSFLLLSDKVHSALDPMAAAEVALELLDESATGQKVPNAAEPASPADSAESNHGTQQEPEGWRQRLTREAAGEVCAIGELLQRHQLDLDPDLLRGLSIRLETLGCAIMGSQDDFEKEPVVFERLYGATAARRRAQNVEGCAA